MFTIQMCDFEKVAERIIPFVLRGPLEQIGIGSDERNFLVGKLNGKFKGKIKDLAYGETDAAEPSDAQRSGPEYGRDRAKGGVQTHKARKDIQSTWKHGIVGQPIFLA